jgi:hypothetical protein
MEVMYSRKKWKPNVTPDIDMIKERLRKLKNLKDGKAFRPIGDHLIFDSIEVLKNFNQTDKWSTIDLYTVDDHKSCH